MVTKTIEIIKKKRTVSDELKAKQKEYRQLKKPIITALKEGPKTIPQIVEETKLSLETVTYHLMTLRKFGKIEAGEIDDMDEYYFYKLKK